MPVTINEIFEMAETYKTGTDTDNIPMQPVFYFANQHEISMIGVLRDTWSDEDLHMAITEMGAITKTTLNLQHVYILLEVNIENDPTQIILTSSETFDTRQALIVSHVTPDLAGQFTHWISRWTRTDRGTLNFDPYQPVTNTNRHTREALDSLAHLIRSVWVESEPLPLDQIQVIKVLRLMGHLIEHRTVL